MWPFLPQTLGLTNAIESLQTILHPPRMVENAQEQRVQTPVIRRLELPNTQSTQVPTDRRATRSKPTALYPLGTIIRRKCEIDNLFHEGEVTMYEMYDTTNNLYRIKYKDGDIDDFNYDEVTKYRKVKQKY